MSGSGGRAESSSHELLLRLGLTMNEHRLVLTAVTAAVLPCLVALFSVLGQDHADGGDWAYLVGALLAIIVGATLQMFSGWASAQAEELSLGAADRLRVALKDALQPVAEKIADMAPLNKAQREERLHHVTGLAAPALAMLFSGVGVDRPRSTVYRVDPSGNLVYMSYFGRGDSVQPRPFERHTLRGEPALAMVRSREEMFVADIDAMDEKSPIYRGSRSGYKTFISCTISDAANVYGMVTVDAPLPGDLSDTDRQVVGLMADLLAIAFAIECRGSTPPTIGTEAATGVDPRDGAVEGTS